MHFVWTLFLVVLATCAVHGIVPLTWNQPTRVQLAPRWFGPPCDPGAWTRRQPSFGSLGCFDDSIARVELLVEGSRDDGPVDLFGFVTVLNMGDKRTPGVDAVPGVVIALSSSLDGGPAQLLMVCRAFVMHAGGRSFAWLLSLHW